jgi:hypothetical protein
MRQRGAALPAVLALVAAVLVIGLAMGTLSTLSLHFNRGQLEGMRAELAARGAVAQLLARLRQHDAAGNLNPLKPDPSNIKELFPSGLAFDEGVYHVDIHFDSERDGYSTDNLAGSAASVGWPDSDDVARVPPYSLDVILNVTGPSLKTQHYRTVLQRIWPFALYAKQGPLTLMSIPGPGDLAPSMVKGDVYTCWMGEEGEGGIQRVGYGLGHLIDPSMVLANIEARAGYQPHKPPNHHLLIGLPMGYNAPVDPSDVHSDSTAQEKFFFYGLDRMKRKFDDVEDSANFSPEVLLDVDKGNHLEGDFFYNHKQIAEVPPYIHPGSSMTGKSVLIRGPGMDPLAQIEEGSGAPSSTFDGAGFERLALHHPNFDLEGKYSLNSADLEYDDGDGSKPHPYLLDDELVLTPTENSTGGALGTHYEIDGSVSNREVIYNKGTSGRGPGLYIREIRSGMRLQNTVLHVKGDLDLSDTKIDTIAPDPDHPSLEIVGAGATVIVDGQLILGNAHINAQDQGFVLYAHDIVLKGGGTFYGLMIAENSISILSQQNDLEIKGALMCAGRGGITLKGTRIEHDPDYLKSINGGGDFAITSWRKLD